MRKNKNGKKYESVLFFLARMPEAKPTRNVNYFDSSISYVLVPDDEVTLPSNSSCLSPLDCVHRELTSRPGRLAVVGHILS